MDTNITELEKMLMNGESRNNGFRSTATEILSQPRLWMETVEYIESIAASLRAFLGDDPHLLFSGAGSSHFVGISVVPALKQILSYVEAISSTEIVMDPESAFPKDNFILVSFARSGESPEGNAAVELAEQVRGTSVRHLVITCNASGALAKIVGGLGDRGYVVSLPEETNDKGLAMTSSFTSMVITGLLLKYLLKNDLKAGKNAVNVLVNTWNETIIKFDQLALQLAEERYKRVYFVSSRPYFGGALEAHLKVQELTGGRIATFATDTLGLRHGFMAAIDDESLVVVTSSSSAYRKKYEVDLLKSISSKGLGKKVLVICDLVADFEQYADLVLPMDAAQGLPEEFRSLLTVIFGQLLGFYSSVANGLNPDSPSPKGIINRVVEGIVIYPYLSL